MGYNLIIVCHAHQVHSYSMRGEESDDIKWWFANHRDCFRQKRIEVAIDADEYPTHLPHAWAHEDRPYLQKLRKLHPELMPLEGRGREDEFLG